MGGKGRRALGLILNTVMAFALLGVVTIAVLLVVLLVIVR
jgi:hypothetical protein